jgi:acetate kinase
MTSAATILTLNGGSSSIKFAIYKADSRLERKMWGSVERVGSPLPQLNYEDSEERKGSFSLSGANRGSTADFLLDWLQHREKLGSIRAVGHRVVQGMKHSEPELVTQELLTDLRAMILFDPDHLPAEIELMETILRKCPQLPQVACFDTAFHRKMPTVAKLLPIPRRYDALGVRRYGFHGLSYTYLMHELERMGNAKGRVILAHLGSGASLAAVLDGQSMDTTMAFTPAAGLVMGTRTGDLDPGLVAFLAHSEKMTAPKFDRLVNQESGLLGVSETSSDMRDLLANEATDERAAEAVALFCYQAKKWIGAYAAVLDGLDTLVFAGGIGENAPVVRSRICAGLEYLDLHLDEASNQAGAGVISTVKSRVAVLVIHTNEESIIAKSVLALLGDRVTANRHDFNTALSGHCQPLSGINKGLQHFSKRDIHATKSQRS